MRVLETGSRHYSHPEKVEEVLDSLLWLSEERGEPFTLVHGDCPDGADYQADMWAFRVNREKPGRVVVERHPADWWRWGKAAGPRRNQEMCDRGADICVGFPESDSRGTYDCMTRAFALGIRTVDVSLIWEGGCHDERVLPELRSDQKPFQ